jgi:hypothetical protein
MGGWQADKGEGELESDLFQINAVWGFSFDTSE